LEVLTEKEHRAHKNLGDVQWLMNLHDPVAEADRVAAAISQHEDPDSFIRDPDKLASGEGAPMHRRRQRRRPRRVPEDAERRRAQAEGRPRRAREDRHAVLGL
jgi:hypothetical protein